MGTQIAYGNVAGVIDVASARTAGAVYTLANAVTPNKLFTANISTVGVVYKAYAFGNGAAATTGGNNYVATTTLVPTPLSNLLTINKTVNFANTQLRNAVNQGGATDSIGNLAFALGSIDYITTANITKLANVLTRIGPTTIRSNIGSSDSNLLVGVGAITTGSNSVNNNKLNPYTVRSNAASNAWIVTTSAVEVAANLRVALGQYFLSNGIFLVSHTGLTSNTGSASSGGGGLTGKIESWT
jgi:hypothetical protein